MLVEAKQTAAIDLRTHTLFVYSNSETTSGLWIHSPPFVPVPVSAPHWLLGKAVRDALKASKRGVRYEADQRWELGGLARLSGIDSWKEFVKGTRHCAIRIRNGRLKIVAYQNRGSSLGFYELPDNTIELPVIISDDELGQAARSVLENLCK
jgi:hypothetical protein